MGCALELKSNNLICDVGKTMEKLIITVGVTGSRITRKQTPYILITPEEIAQSGIEAWRAGASSSMSMSGTQRQNWGRRIFSIQGSG